MATSKLTRREIEVLNLTANGNTRSEVAQLLSLSEETVKDRLDRACRKLHAVNRTHAVALAVTLGLVSLRVPKNSQGTTD